MNEEQFKEFAERIASEDETRIALRSAFQWSGHSIVSDGRVALVVDKAFESLPAAADSQETIGRSLYNDILPGQSKDEYAEFNLDVDLLGRAATATAQDLAPEMETLRHYVADPDDPDDMDSYDSERYVLERHTYVIMPDPRRSVIAGYYASVIADICKGRAVRAYASQKTSNKTLYVKGDTWQLAIMPIRMVSRRRNIPYNEIRGTAVADAKTGELVWHRKEDDACPIDTLRFPKESEVAK